MLIRHTTLALAIALQLGSATAWAADPVPALPATPPTQTATVPVAATPATAAPVTPATLPATAATPAVKQPVVATPVATPAAVSTTTPVAKPVTATPAEVKPVVVVEDKATDTNPGAKRHCHEPLLTPAEREAHREKMRTLAPEERQAYMAEHRAMMRQRMRETVGIADEANPRPDFNRPHPLMSAAEQATHQEKMRTLTGEEREAYLDAHHAQMRDRAEKQAEADAAQMPPEFAAQRKRIMELRDQLRQEMGAYRAKMQEYWADNMPEGSGPEMMGRPWPRPGWQMPGPGYGPGPWGVPDGGVPPYLPRGGW